MLYHVEKDIRLFTHKSNSHQLPFFFSIFNINLFPTFSLFKHTIHHNGSVSHNTPFIHSHFPLLHTLPKTEIQASTRSTTVAGGWKPLRHKTCPVQVFCRMGPILWAHYIGLVWFDSERDRFKFKVG